MAVISSRGVKNACFFVGFPPQRVVDECRQPNTYRRSGIRHGLNLNQVHTWRRLPGGSASVRDFVRLPLPTTSEFLLRGDFGINDEPHTKEFRREVVESAEKVRHHQ